MNTPIKKRRNPSTPFIVTFVLGLLIGLSLGYAFWGAESGRPQEASAPSSPTEPAVPPAETQTVRVDEAAKPAPPAESASAKPESPAPSEPVTPAPSERRLASRHMFIAIPGTSLDEATRAFLAEFRPFGIALRDENIETEEQTRALIAEIKKACGTGEALWDSPLIAIEQEGEPANRLKLDKAPSPASLGRAADASAVRGVGAAYAQACKDRGIAIVLAPLLDVYNPESKAAIADRYFADNGPMVAALGLAFAAGVMDRGIIPVAKHFPGQGAALQDPHVELAIIDRPAQELSSSVYPFFEAAARDVPGMMTGHVALPKIDTGSDQPRPATVSPVLITDMLRRRWQYDGVVMSADLDMAAITARGTSEAAAVEALAAGCDVVTYLNPDPQRIRAIAQAIEDAAAAQGISAQRIEESQARLDQWQAWLRDPKPFEGELPVVPPVHVAKADATPAEPEAATTKETTQTEPNAPAQAVQTEEPQTAPALSPAPDATQSSSAESQQATEPPPVQEPAEPAAPTPAAADVAATVPPDSQKIRHEIARGETLGAIASKYNVAKADIVAWNKLKSEELKYGFFLDIYVPKTQSAAPGTESDSAPTPEPPEAPTATPTATEEPVQTESAQGEVAPPAPTTTPEYHVIEQGDTLMKISRRYGVSLSDLRAWNQLQDDNIKFGFKLRLTAPNAPAEETEPAASSSPALPAPPAKYHSPGSHGRGRPVVAVCRGRLRRRYRRVAEVERAG